MDYKCEFCDGELGEFIRDYSYFFRCLNCKEDGAATSFDAVKDKYLGEYEVYKIDDDLEEKSFFTNGMLKNIIREIERKGFVGELFYLKMIEN